MCIRDRSGELRLIYLMNDAVESFLVLKNARMTGNYVRDYEGEFEGSVEKLSLIHIYLSHTSLTF